MTESTNRIKKLTIVVGAGDDYSCRFDNEQHHYLLIDARREAVERLQQTYADEPRVQIKQALISGKAHLITFYRYSLPEFSSTLKPDTLTQLLPGLAIKGDEEVSAESLAELISEAAGAKFIELILNVPGQELSMLSSLSSETLLKLDSLIAVTQSSKLYQNGNTASELSDWLFDQNFDKNHETDQAFSLVTQDWSIDKKALRITQLERERDEAVARASDAEKERDEAVARASSTSKELEKVTAQREEANQKAQKLENELKELRIENQALKQKLESAEKYNEQLAKLNKRMDYMFEQQRLQLEQATNALGRHITQTSNQQVTELKARLSLERTFGKSLINLNDNDSNLSEVTAVALTQQLEENSYDLIIEFGAGKSTEFLANAIINNHSPNRQLENKSAANGFDSSDFDLPQHMLSFEHDKKQFNAVKQRIEQNSLQNLVDLKYAPLIPVSQSQELFYDCGRALTNVASVLDGRDAKVLILINSSTSQKQPSCKAAVPTILNSLSALRLDIVTSGKMFSQETMSYWQQLITERCLEFDMNQNSGMCFLRIN